MFDNYLQLDEECPLEDCNRPFRTSQESTWETLVEEVHCTIALQYLGCLLAYHLPEQEIALPFLFD